MNYLTKAKFIIILVIMLIEVFCEEKSGEEKRKEAIEIIQDALDKEIINLPPSFDFLEESIIGFFVDLAVKYLNSSGIFNHKTTGKAPV